MPYYETAKKAADEMVNEESTIVERLTNALQRAERVIAQYVPGSVDATTGEAKTPLMQDIRAALALDTSNHLFALVDNFAGQKVHYVRSAAWDEEEINERSGANVARNVCDYTKMLSRDAAERGEHARFFHIAVIATVKPGKAA